jgi:hypothetical protein
MGQSRYERLPKTKNWQNVVALLAASSASAPQLASASATACKGELRRHSDDPILLWALYILARLPLAARQGEGGKFLQETGIDPKALAFPALLLEETGSFLQRKNFHNLEPSFVSDIALNAFQETVTKILDESNLDLFADATTQLEPALAGYGTPRGFATCARLFFTSFMNRVLAYFLSKETVNVLGQNERFGSLDSLRYFLGDLRRYCWESSQIIDSFAEEWYSKYRWQEKLDLAHMATFAWAAIKKFSGEIGREHE